MNILLSLFLLQVVVGVAGPSGAGKTVFTEKVQGFLPGLALLQMDMYNDARRLVDSNFDDPRLPDYDCLIDNIRALCAGRAAQVPIYDFRQSRRVGYRQVTPPSARVVVVEVRAPSPKPRFSLRCSPPPKASRASALCHAGPHTRRAYTR